MTSPSQQSVYFIDSNLVLQLQNQIKQLELVIYSVSS